MVAQVLRLTLTTALLAGVGSGASVDAILSYQTLGEIVVSPDGHHALFVATRANFESNVLDSNLWIVSLDSGESTQLTFAPRRDWHPRFSPDGRELAFLSDRDGSPALWKIRVGAGEAQPPFRVEGAIEAFEWLPDGSGWIFTMEDPEAESDVVEVDRQFRFARLYRIRSGETLPELLLDEDVHVGSFDVAPDGTWAALSVQPTPSVPDERLHSDLVALDLVTLERRALVVRPGLDIDPAVSPDSARVAFVSMNGEADWIGNYGVSVVSRDGVDLVDLSLDLDARAGGPLRWSTDGAVVYTRALEGMARRVFAVDAAAGKTAAASEFDRERVVSSFAPLGDGGFLVAASDPHTPAELYRIGPEERKLTGLNGGYDLGAVGTTETLRYARAGLDLEGLVVKPVGYEPGKAYPLLLVIHGGPAGVFDASFTPRRGVYPVHAFSERGYVVFMPNPRGSSGYGDAFRRANLKDWGFGDYEDIMAGVDQLIARGLVDPARMGVMGWSYGGFMTSWTVTHTDRFKAASIGAPVTNPYSFYGVTDIPDFAEAYFGGKPWDDDVDYLRHAPENFAAQATTPSLIQHGADDVRVPLSQGTAFYRALKLSGVEVEMVIYPREPHGLREPRHIKDALERNLAWFQRWLMDDATHQD